MRPSRIELSALETLLAVAEQGSIGAASRALGLRQPSLSSRLQRLEREAGIALFERSSRGTRLTKEGATVADWARAVFAASDRLETGVAALRRRHASHLDVSASMTIAEYMVPHWLAEFRTVAPEAAVSLRVGNSEQVSDDVVQQRADLGFVEGVKVSAKLHHRAFAADQLVVVVGLGHPWAKRRLPLTAAELASTPLILREPGSGTRETLTHALGAVDLTPSSPKLELGSTAAIKAAVHAGEGISVLSRLAILDDVASGRLVTVDLVDLELERRLRIIWRKGDVLSKPARHLAGIAQQSANRSGVIDPPGSVRRV